MNETPYFVRTNKDGSQIMIPYSLMVSYDDIGNMNDIVFPPVQLQDSLFLTKKVGRMSFGYPVNMDDSVDEIISHRKWKKAIIHFSAR